MSTTWSMTADDIIRGALELCGVIGIADTVTADDSALCLRALNGIFKEMPLHGLSWPKVSSAAVSLTWAGVTPSKVTPPADYFGVPVLKYTNATGTLTQVYQLAKPAYEALNLAQIATYPIYFHVLPDKTFGLWPAPTIDPVLKLTYQSIVSDIVNYVTPDIGQAYLNGLQYWLADEVSLKFGITGELRTEIALRAKQKRSLMMAWSVETGPISFEVDDHVSRTNNPLIY